MELSKRLFAVADMVTRGSRVADVGCDHGYVSIFLVEHGISDHVIAMDVNQGPLEKAKKHIARSGLSTQIETRLSDGICGLQENEADTVICAGMGGRLTIHILESGDHLLLPGMEVILQPQSELFLVRAYLREHGFEVIGEDMIFEDGKYYPMMKAVRKSIERDETDDKGSGADSMASERGISIFDKFGPMLLEQKHPVLLDYLEKSREKYQNILDDLLEHMEHPSRTLRVEEIKQELQDLKTALTYYHS